jgi:hypothetical protein
MADGCSVGAAVHTNGGPQGVQLRVHLVTMYSRSVPSHSPARAQPAQLESKSTQADGAGVLSVGISVPYDGMGVGIEGAGVIHVGDGEGTEPIQKPQLAGQFRRMNSRDTVWHAPARTQSGQFGSMSKQNSEGDVLDTGTGCDVTETG